MSAPRKRPDWSRRLPRPLVIANLTTLTTLGDVRDLIERHLPAPYREKATWQYVAAQLAEAARGNADTIDVDLDQTRGAKDSAARTLYERIGTFD